METAPVDLKIEDIENLKLNVETHYYTCIRYEHESDNGFSGNLALLLEAIEHSDKVKCEGIKLIAKGILKSVIHHKVIKHDMKEVNHKIIDNIEKEKEMAKPTEEPSN